VRLNDRWVISMVGIVFAMEMSRGVACMCNERSELVLGANDLDILKYAIVLLITPFFTKEFFVLICFMTRLILIQYRHIPIVPLSHTLL
jgi:hypothetical protein